MAKLSVRNLTVRNRRVFVRVDFNVPLEENGTITDDTRIRAALPTIQYLMEQGATVILGSHLGKPKGKRDFKYSLRPVAEYLKQMLNDNLYFAPDCIGSEVVRFLQQVPPNSVILLENLRFHPGEEKNDPDFARALATLGDLYVNDAFGTAHRAHASTVGMTVFFAQPAAGFLLERELQYLEPLLETPVRPFLVIIGGAKVADKAGVIKNLLPRVDHLLLGGAVAFSFLKARGIPIGKSRWEPELMAEVEQLKDSPKLLLPVDIVAAATPDGAETRIVPVEQIGNDEAGFDIGPKTIEMFCNLIATARTIVWAGPMGMFEKQAFSHGSTAIARALTQATAHGAITIAGGGDTGAALRQAGVAAQISHLSTGGSATLEFLEGRNLPGIAALADVP